MQKEGFSSRWGFVLAAAGSAIGLGNVWRFPYLVGEYGGLSFILVYLFAVLIICNPLMVAEIALGRTAKSSFVDAYEVIGSRVKAKNLGIWKFFGGWVALISLWMIVSFYFVVAGWVVYYLLEAVSGDLLSYSAKELVQGFDVLAKSFTIQFGLGFMFLLLTALVVLGGVKKGIEKCSIYLMPVLFILLLVMVFQSLFWDKSHGGIKFLLTPNWEILGFREDGFYWGDFAKVFMVALGQAFISLSLGFGVLLVYGSYLKDKENIFKTVKQIEFFDTGAAVLSAFVVIPAIFAGGIEPTAGPQLTFISLPLVFSRMPYGEVGAILFYCLLILATLTSTISILEAVTNFFMRKFNIERFEAIGGTLIFVMVGFLPVCLSFSGAVDIKFLGRDLFSFFDWVASTYLTAIVSLTMALFVGYKCMKQVIKNIAKGTDVPQWFVRYFLAMLRFVVPLFLILMLGLAFFKDL